MLLQSHVPHPPITDTLSPCATRIGIDLVDVAAIETSIAEFGAQFTQRLFSPGELRAATVAGRLDAGLLAQRFAAKEAAIKAFDLSDAGVGWSQIEVLEVDAAGAGRMRLHGRAGEVAATSGGYETAAALSLAEGLACAIVVAMPATQDTGKRAQVRHV